MKLYSYLALVSLTITLLLTMSTATPSNLGKVYSLWHCGVDACMWEAPVNTSYLDWVVNRGDGKPTANLFIFSFLNPINVLTQGVAAVPPAITLQLVQYLQSKGLSVMFSIGGESWSGEWDDALGKDPVTLGLNAAAIAKQFGVGIEIDYENEASTPKLDAFVKAYRSVFPMDNSTSAADTSLLTVDTGAGTGYLTSVSLWSAKWLEEGLINWINAMVTSSPYGSLPDATQYWDEHLTGASWANIPPINPDHLVVSLYSCDGSPNCDSFKGTMLQQTIGWVGQQSTRGISFWAGGCAAPNACCNDCTGLEQGSETYLG
ncbi:hypothetical protein SAMD00019534_116490 [Acytostelium subglobosum LB1]|uniref:hypothetical protein n=1 Tax=Acytostelium subglobosum LB1 TaxID=1410327 RepID=UPI000644C2AE|nr:hypothetical protein SAMD00019534_116490 [Acytostelium subglobosum LB1]GAM28473.1 hypothetical protein SAMD00019534_116490 [Acytostelium subglobosum LB1]|eukprot:XP_012748512.1 hypothetical protein SAMD00019534_116490 [Acytostelium subglobosum LB1]